MTIDTNRLNWIYLGRIILSITPYTLEHFYLIVKFFFARLFSVMAEMKANKSWPTTFIFRFVGTGERKGVSITSLSIEYGVNDIVEEYPHRIPFLAVQSLLRKASGSIIIGSTEPHYTASKTFQCLLAGNPIFAIFHSESSASTFMEEANADAHLVKWNQDSESELYTKIHQRLNRLRQRIKINLATGFNQIGALCFSRKCPCLV